MKTLALSNGDLVVVPHGYQTYSGAQKIVQDLGLALREVYGGDQLHPRWGSILLNYIGTPLTADVKANVINEINRVLKNYISVQNAQISDTIQSGSKSSMTTDDIVESVLNIDANQVFDSLVVTVTLQTVSRQTLTLSQVVTT